MEYPFVRTPFNYDRDKASRLSGLICLDPSRTKSEFAQDSDINVIAERFKLGYQLPTDGVPAPTFEDFTSVGDYHSALNLVRAAAGAFMELPAKVRSRFQNDPQLLVEFCSDPANLPEMQLLGLTKPLEPRQGTPVPAQSPALVAAPSGAVPSSS